MVVSGGGGEGFAEVRGGGGGLSVVVGEEAGGSGGGVPGLIGKKRGEELAKREKREKRKRRGERRENERVSSGKRLSMRVILVEIHLFEPEEKIIPSATRAPPRRPSSNSSELTSSILSVSNPNTLSSNFRFDLSK